MCTRVMSVYICECLRESGACVHMCGRVAFVEPEPSHVSGHVRASPGLLCRLPVGDLGWLSLMPPSAFSAQCQHCECQVWGPPAVTWRVLLSVPLPASPICVWAACPTASPMLNAVCMSPGLCRAVCGCRKTGAPGRALWGAELGWAAMAAQRAGRGKPGASHPGGCSGPLPPLPSPCRVCAP